MPFGDFEGAQVVCEALFDVIWLQSTQTAVRAEPEVGEEFPSCGCLWR